MFELLQNKELGTQRWSTYRDDPERCLLARLSVLTAFSLGRIAYKSVETLLEDSKTLQLIQNVGKQESYFTVCVFIPESAYEKEQENKEL